MIEVQLRQYGVFQELIHHMKRHFLSDIQGGKLCLHFNSDQVRLQGFLLRDIAFMDIRLDPSKVFKNYQCNGSVTIDPDFLAFSQVLKQHEHDSVVKMLVRTDSIIVLSEQPDSVQKTELAVQTADFRNVPDDHFKCIMTMPTLKLQQETTLNGTQGDACSISAKDGAVYLSSTDLGRVLTVTKRVLSSSNKVSLVINNTLPAVSFGTQYLRKLLNALMSSDNTTLSVANQIPLKISQPIMEFTNTQEKAEIAGDLAYFVAPKMNEGAENDDFVMPEAFSKTREACFQGQLIHGRKFADIIQSLGKDFRQVVLECSETRLRIRGMCRSHISLAMVDLTTKDFSLLECDKAFSLGCGLQHLAQVLEDVKETDVVSLAIHETKEEGLFPWIELTVHSGANQDEITVKGKCLDRSTCCLIRF